MNKMRIYATRFHGIQFEELGLDLSPYKKMKVDDHFWSCLQKKVKLLKTIPDYEKIQNAHQGDTEILNKIATSELGALKGKNILSIGAGLGITENELVRRFGCNVTALEYERDSNWNEQIKHITNLDQIEKNEQFDIVMIISVLYAIDDSGIYNLNDQLKRVVKSNSLLIIAEQDLPSIWYFVTKFVVRMIRHVFFKQKMVGEVIWGFARSQKEINNLLWKNFDLVGTKFFKNDLNWSKKEINNPFKLFGFQVFGFKRRSDCYFTWFKPKI